MQEHSVDLKLFVRQVFLVKSLCMVESLKSNWSISSLKLQFSCCLPICSLHPYIQVVSAKILPNLHFVETTSRQSQWSPNSCCSVELQSVCLSATSPNKSLSKVTMSAEFGKIQMMELCFLVILMSHILEQLGIAPSRRSLVWIPTNPLMQFK